MFSSNKPSTSFCCIHSPSALTLCNHTLNNTETLHSFIHVYLYNLTFRLQYIFIHSPSIFLHIIQRTFLSLHFVEFFTAGELVLKTTALFNPNADLGLKELFRNHDMSDKVFRTQFCEALAIVQATTYSDVTQMIPSAGGVIQKSSCWITKPMDDFLLKIVKKYSDRILLKESDRKPKISKKKQKKQLPINRIPRENHLDKVDEWQGIAPWDPLVGGDGNPKFLCDVMVSSLILL